jgi:mono/diheme cytochrome c family protein
MAGIGYKKAQALYAAATAVVVLLPVRAYAEEAGDPQLGLTYAVANCAEYHEVNGARDKSPNPSAPSFASVASTPGLNGRALAVWLQTSHPTMPNLVITREDREDVIAYIMSLRLLPKP